MGQLGRRLRQGRDLLQLLHRHDTLRKSFSRFQSFVHFDQVLVHLREVLIDKLVHNLRGQVHPDVQDAVLRLVLERLEQVLFDIADDGMSAPKVQLVPLAVALAVADPLLADGAISQQMIDKLDAEHLDLVVLLKATHIDVIALRYVEEDAINEEQERLYVQKLAPAEAQIEEKLSQSLIVDALAVQLIDFALLAEGSKLASLV